MTKPQHLSDAGECVTGSPPAAHLFLLWSVASVTQQVRRRETEEGRRECVNHGCRGRKRQKTWVRFDNSPRTTASLKSSLLFQQKKQTKYNQYADYQRWNDVWQFRGFFSWCLSIQPMRKKSILDLLLVLPLRKFVLNDNAANQPLVMSQKLSVFLILKTHWRSNRASQLQQ